ncbi:hypothetical protein F2Q69_00029546 [Brassica cretica]|uniref:Uncharacterized protein n=1 Tax=Brassica cretica TaxID=69181 RepID=A0A8S9S1L3_BRACR|nr:hypothetical protein F2Q69_00029546 [Brassica cretica]
MCPECSSAASVELTETRNNATIQETITAIVRYVEIMEKGFFGLKSRKAPETYMEVKPSIHPLKGKKNAHLLHTMFNQPVLMVLWLLSNTPHEG